MPDTDWIKELKPGDEVLICHYGNIFVAKVESIQRGIIIANGLKFNHKGAQITKDRYYRTHIEPVTAEIKEELQKSAIINTVVCKIGRITANKITYSQAVRILEILNEKE